MNQASTPIPAAVALLPLIIAATGFYQIRPGEATAIQTFGAATTRQVQKSRVAELGFQTLPTDKIDLLTGENWQRDYQAATMITGDLGLPETQLVAHYYISDLNAYLFQADDPGVSFEYPDGDEVRTERSHPPDRPDGQTSKDALEISIRRAAGQRTIDQALTTERESIELETKEYAQDILNRYRAGLTITPVQLQEVKPPDEVQAAFDDVLRAQEERETRINAALTFESQTLPEARGQAEKIRFVKTAEALEFNNRHPAQTGI